MASAITNNGPYLPLSQTTITVQLAKESVVSFVVTAALDLSISCVWILR